MPRALPPELPEPLRRLLDGEDLAAKEGETILLLTATPDGWPRLALLSVGELYAPTATALWIALWPDSRTTANLTATGRATLSAILEGVVYDVELEAHREGDIGQAGGHLARFSAVVRSARSDVVGYADLASGIRYRLKQREQVIARWRATIAALREGPAATPEAAESDGMRPK